MPAHTENELGLMADLLGLDADATIPEAIEAALVDYLVIAAHAMAYVYDGMYTLIEGIGVTPAEAVRMIITTLQDEETPAPQRLAGDQKLSAIPMATLKEQFAEIMESEA